MLICTMSLVMNIVVLNIHHRSPHTHVMPNCVSTQHRICLARVCPGFFIRAKPKAESRGGAATPPTSSGSGECCELPSGARCGARPPKGFTLFSALRMASPDTIILFIVDYHAANREKTPVLPPLRTPLFSRLSSVILDPRVDRTMDHPPPFSSISVALIECEGREILFHAYCLYILSHHTAN